MNNGWLVAAVAAFAAAGCIPAAAPASPEELAAAKKTCGPDGLIDDCEDNNNQISQVKGRGGYWYTFGDKTGSSVTPSLGGTFTMAAGGANGSSNAAHMTGKVGNAAIVYVGMGFNFVDPKGQYDASAYKGISFWAKAGAGTTKVRMKIPDVNTDPDGKVCSSCFNDFGKDLELTSAWTQYVIPFADMKQLPDWGAPHPSNIEPKKIYGVQWQVNSPGANFDIWVDDLQFTGCK